MAIGNATAAAATSRRSRAAVCWLLGFLLLVALPAHAEELVVRDGGAALYAAPSRKAPVVAQAVAGDRLRIVGGGGDWFSVSKAGDDAPDRGLWIQAARVATAPVEEQFESALPDFTLEIAGSPLLEIRTACTLVRFDLDKRRRFEFDDEIPASYEFDGDALSCTVRNRDGAGVLEVTLRDADGDIVAAAASYDSFATVRVRSDGPWGAAQASARPGRVIFVRDLPRLGPVPPFSSTPVPPFTSNPVPPIVPAR